MTTHVLDAVRAGLAQFGWVPLDLSDGCTIEVTADAVKVECVRHSTTPVEAQQVADELGACLLTPLLADLLWLRADVRLHPHPQPVAQGPWTCPDCLVKHAGPWARCQPCGEIEHSRAIDEELAGRVGLVANVGKPWILSQSCFVVRCSKCGHQESSLEGRCGKCGWATKSLGMIGQPYGWYTHAGGVMAASTRTLSVIQGCRPAGRGAPHDGKQLDYAEPVKLWRWPGHDPAELVCHPDRWILVSHEGPLPAARLPGVPLP